jgi:tryptophanyl-tRNA synthetase
VTDSGTEIRADDEAKPGITNLLRIYSALTGDSVPDLERRYAGAGYGAFKKAVGDVVADTFAPIRERTEQMLADEDQLDKLLAHGAARARSVAGPTMATVRDRVGFLPAR